jgi:hypothetical protein
MKENNRNIFLSFSEEVTGFSEFYLEGTGQVDLYFSILTEMLGEYTLQELLSTFDNIKMQSKDNNEPSMLLTKLNLEIFESEKLGLIARNIIKLWYVATWYQLPLEWQQKFGSNEIRRKEHTETFIASAQAYPEGLLWLTIGVNPPGAKAPGYGTWSDPPTVSLNSI